MQPNHHYLGLSDAQISESRRKYGINVLTPPKRTPYWIKFLEKFTDPIIIILLVALILSVGVSFYEFNWGKDAGRFGIFLEPLGILVALLLATVVGFLFEQSANRKFEILNKVNDDTPVKVIRNGNICQTEKKDIVVGDIVILETGEEVPADGELLEAVSLQINESTLTGEPICKKTVNPADFDSDATYPSNYAMKGTTVADGHGIMKVRKVGDASEYGKVYKGAQLDNKIETPLNRQLNGLAGLIAKASYSISALIVVGRLTGYFIEAGGFTVVDWVHFGNYILKTIMIAVTVIVVAVPEGLPMSVTLSLALSMKRMLSTNNLVRKMHACETMGAATVICTDKTGTLTQNRMKVFETQFYGHTSDAIYENIAINSTAYLDHSDGKETRSLGNPTEGALLLWLHENGIDYLPLREQAEIIDRLTFSTERKYMATIAKSPLSGRKTLYVKGAPEIILGMSSHIPVAKEEIEGRLFDYQGKAMRTLGFAYQDIDDADVTIEDGKIHNSELIFLGIVAISDPVRPDVPEAISDCIDAGIDIKIVTGDTPGTAKEIGRQIGLWRTGEPEDHHITGVEFAAMPDDVLSDRVLSLKIISRARPMDKQRLVRLLQQRGQVVAVTGDGTNDAPALNQAQVGLSMGDGTSVAKEASDITILDNSFSSITRAVMWGRSLYRNIQRFILFQMTINITACITILAGAFLGTESPLTVTQMLWVNLIMDTFAALALASLPPNRGVMKDRPRRATDFIISRSMWFDIILTGILFVLLLFGLVQYFRHEEIGGLRELTFSGYFGNFFNFGRYGALTSYELSLFFTIFVMLQFWNMFNSKAFMTGRSTFSGLSGSTGFLAVSAAILGGQWLIVTVGGEMFSTVPLRYEDWFLVLVSTSVVLFFGEFLRLLRR
ncbi:MAG: calcium-translocating P-type ATPase, PMCA-type [Dysgonamonadaceae bacterium]|jgi:Ca2+-transporting ATPase|nr:calcium-translocating P-type ATPase, PMCA-type [Dysgonamonadaceae bacterium]